MTRSLAFFLFFFLILLHWRYICLCTLNRHTIVIEIKSKDHAPLNNLENQRIEAATPVLPH